MSGHDRGWDESRSPQWKYLFQKESANRRKTRKEIEKDRKIRKEEENETYKKGNLKKAIKEGKKNIRKVSKEQLKEKLKASNDARIRRLLETEEVNL